MFSPVTGETDITRKRGSLASPLSPDRIGAVTPSLRDAAGGPLLLGVSIRPDRMGKVTQPGENYGVLREPEYSVPRRYRTLRLRTRICWRCSSYARLAFAPLRAP